MWTTDDEIIAHCQQGDREAFHQLLKLYQHKVYNIAFRFMGNENDALDVAQEVFLKVYRKINSFRGESSFLTWLYHLTANTCRDHLRKRTNKTTVSLEDLGEHAWRKEAEVMNSRATGPEETALQRERQQRLHQLMQKLPPEQRLILIMREIQGFSYEEISASLECSPGTVKSRLSRARQALRELLLPERELFGLPNQVTASGERG